MAVEWADCGISGTSGGLYDVYSTILGGKSNPERLSEDLGTGWALLDGYTKIYACCQHLHSAVEAAIDLRQHHPEVAAIADIDSIGVETHGLALPLVNANPHTTLGAKFSMPHAVASALATGAAGAAAFSADSLKDPRIAALRARVSTGAWLPIMPPPDDRPARVTVRLRDGRAFSAECMSARGGPDRPLPEDAWVEKMHTLASPVYPAMVEVFSDLVQADARRLAQPWPEIVTEIVNSRSRPVSSPRSFL